MPHDNPFGAVIDAETAFTASLSPEQRELMAAYVASVNNLASEQVGRVVDGICAQLPGLKPAIEALASVSHADLAGGSCACWPKSSPADATPTWPEKGDGGLAIDDRLELLVGLVNHLPTQRAVLLALADHIARNGQDWPRCCAELYPELNLTLL